MWAKQRKRGPNFPLLHLTLSHFHNSLTPSMRVLPSWTKHLLKVPGHNAVIWYHHFIISFGADLQTLKQCIICRKLCRVKETVGIIHLHSSGILWCPQKRCCWELNLFLIELTRRTNSKLKTRKNWETQILLLIKR